MPYYQDQKKTRVVHYLPTYKNITQMCRAMPHNRYMASQSHHQVISWTFWQIEDEKINFLATLGRQRSKKLKSSLATKHCFKHIQFPMHCVYPGFQIYILKKTKICGSKGEIPKEKKKEKNGDQNVFFPFY